MVSFPSLRNVNVN